MHSLKLINPDGRSLTLYSTQPIAAGLTAPSPFPEPQHANPHLRWHPLRGEWVTYAAFLQNRIYQPPPEYNPLAPMRDPAHPTEMPRSEYDIAVFDNRFPSLSLEARDPPALTVPTAPAQGHCEVVVFTQDPLASLGALPLARIELLLQVWGERTVRLGAHPQIRYVLPFENRGAEVGVSLHHPHGQIYAYPVVPPVPARMLAQEAEHLLQHGASLLCELARTEAAHGERVLYLGEHAIAFVPPCARDPYEGWVMPTAPTRDFAALGTAQRADLARAQDGAAQVRAPVGAAVPLPDGVVPGAHRRRSASRNPDSRPVFPAVSQSRPPQVPGRDRTGRRPVRHGCAARVERARTAAGRCQRGARMSAPPSSAEGTC